MTVDDTMTRPPFDPTRDDYLYGFTIYAHPPDFPHHYVMRAWRIGSGSADPEHADVGVLCESLDEARAHIPAYCTVLPRWANDPICVVESWL